MPLPDPRLGPALASSDEELAAAARITPEDLAKVRGWLEVYGPKLAPLVEAEPYEREWLTLPLISGFLAGGARYLWLTQQGLYYDLRLRRALDPEDVRRQLDRSLDRAAREARQHTMTLRGGPNVQRRISLVDWELGMRQRVKTSTAAAHLSAIGGVRRTHLGAMERMQETVLEQYVHLRRFAAQIDSGAALLDGRALSRSAMYIQSARAAYMQARGDVALSVGYDQARTILAIADHCRTSRDRPGCVEEARRGWVPIADLVLPGYRTCLGNCRCSVAYRNSMTGEEYGGAGIQLEVA